MDKRVASWLMSRDTGLSSEAIVAFMEGAEGCYFHYPHDPDDLGRCLRLLMLVPEYNERLPFMMQVSKQWCNLIMHWGEISALYYEELPSRNAPKCYTRMRELLAQVGS